MHKVILEDNANYFITNTVFFIVNINTNPEVKFLKFNFIQKMPSVTWIVKVNTSRALSTVISNFKKAEKAAELFTTLVSGATSPPADHQSTRGTQNASLQLHRTAKQQTKVKGQSENQRGEGGLLKKPEHWHGMESERASSPAGIYCNPKVLRWAPLCRAPESSSPVWGEIISIRISSHTILALRTKKIKRTLQYLRSGCPSITAYPVGRAPALSRLREQGFLRALNSRH